MNPNLSQVTKILLISGWVDILAGSYHEGERTGYTYPPIWWATTATGSTTLWGRQDAVLALQLG